MKRNCLLALGLALVVTACGDNPAPTDANSPDLASTNLTGTDRLNVLLKAPLNAANRAELSKHGTIYGELAQINAVLMRAKAEKLAAIRALPFVAGANEDQPRNAPPSQVVEAEAFTPLAPHNVWNLDAINVTDFDAAYEGTAERLVPQDGSGVVVALLDTGLMPFWPFYLAGKHVDVDNSTTFLGGGASGTGSVVSPPDKWQRDVVGHGTLVASIITGYRFQSAITGAFQVEGVAPEVTVVVIKVLNQNGAGFTSGIAQGVVYATDLVLAGGPHAGKRLVINESLGGAVLDVVEKAALDYAVDHNVVVVAAAGNDGPTGNIGFPAAYHRVISAANAGWIGEYNNPGNGTAEPNPDPICAPLPIPEDALTPARFWRQCDVPDPFAATNFYIDPSSSRDPDGLAFEEGDVYDLDVAAPASQIVGPWGFNNGQLNYAIAGGTSFSTAHVTGIVALMLQKHSSLTPAQIEACLESAAHPLPDTDQQFIPGPGASAITPPSWGEDRSGHGFITADEALSASGCFS